MRRPTRRRRQRETLCASAPSAPKSSTPDRAPDVAQCPGAVLESSSNRAHFLLEIRPNRAFPLVFEGVSPGCDVKIRHLVVFASFVGGCALQGCQSQSLDGFRAPAF